MLAKVTLSGMLHYDPTLMDGLTVPQGVSRETLIDRVLVRAGEFPLLYADPAYLKAVISSFSAAYQLEMIKTWEALNEDYNPIHNYDRYEEYTDQETGQSSNTTSSSDSSTGTSTDSYQGDNGGGWAEAQKNDSTNSGTGSSSVQANGTTSSQHSGHLYGNIGVTLSQQMLTAELDLRLSASWYDLWASRLVADICIPVY